MAINTELEHATLDELFLDPLNPRLGRSQTGPDVKQDVLRDLMKDWTLDELAVSFLESGFWPNEALLAVNEKLYGEQRLVVVEGNRRLAALMSLRDTFDGDPPSSKWAEIVKGVKRPTKLFNRIPYVLVDKRTDIDAFTGFRHVTGIKEWNPAEKAEFIAKLIDSRGMSYEEVMRKIGSKTPAVRQNYISFRLLLQIDENVENIPAEKVEDRFSVMYLTLRTKGAQKYLHIDIRADPAAARRPVPKSRLKALANFAFWLFGDDKRPPLFTDSRQAESFGAILESESAIQYLERTENPSFEVAYRTAGGDEPELVRLIRGAADNIELALTRIHLYRKSKKLQHAVERLGADAMQLLEVFPSVRDELMRNEQ
jgi:hypothetical protein